MDWDDIKFFAVVVLVISLIITTLVGGMGTLVYFVNKKSCNTQFQNWNHYYTFWAGCMIEVNGRYIPVDIYRQTDTKIIK